MTPNTNEFLKQFARVGRVFSRPIIKNRYPRHLITQNDFVSNSIFNK